MYLPKHFEETRVEVLHDLINTHPLGTLVTPGSSEIDKMLTSIVGIEIPVTRLLGKWKISQNRPLADRHGVIAGLESDNRSESGTMAELVRKSIT